MRALIVALSISILPVSAAFGAVTIVPPPKPKVVATPTPEPKKGVIGRIFGRRPAATPTPAPAVVKPAATPTASKPKSRPKRKAATPTPAAAEPAATSETKAPEKKAEAETQPPAPRKPEAQPKPNEAATTPPAPEPAEKPVAAEKPQASTKKGGKKGATAPAATKIDTSNMDEAAKYRVAKAAAQEDATIRDLQAKAEGAISDSEAHAASVAYNKALFRKVRDIEPSIDSYVDKLEEAMMKRLNSEKKRE